MIVGKARKAVSHQLIHCYGITPGSSCSVKLRISMQLIIWENNDPTTQEEFSLVVKIVSSRSYWSYLI